MAVYAMPLHKPQTVYITHIFWSNPDNEGSEIISVRNNHEDARQDMRENIAKTEAIYDADIWDPDYCLDGEDLVTRGFEGDNAFEPPTTYRWEVSSHEVT